MHCSDSKAKAGSDGLIDGLQGMVDAAGITIAKFVKIQATTLKTVMKYVRKGKRSMYNEPPRDSQGHHGSVMSSSMKMAWKIILPGTTEIHVKIVVSGENGRDYIGTVKLADDIHIVHFFR